MAIASYEKNHILALRRNLAECTLFLKRDGAFPLAEAGKIAAYGSGVRHTVKGGTGSGDVNSHFTVSVERGLSRCGFCVTTDGWLDSYDAVRQEACEKFISEIRARARKKHMSPAVVGMGEVMTEPEYQLPLDGEGDTAIYVLSRICGEGSDRRPVKGDIYLTDTEVRDILALDRKYEHFMLVLNTGGPVDLTPVLSVSNILLLSQLGVETGLILGRILLGRMNPSGKLTTTWAAYPDYPTVGDFGDINETRYREGIYVGYRYFDSVGKTPLFPFGFGLSYTQFAIGNTEAVLEGDEIVLTAEVTNTGSYAGKEVVQVYVSKPEGKLDQPYQSLAGWHKTKKLEPGGSERVEIRVSAGSLASYDEEISSYVLEPGDYQLRIGNSSRSTTPAAVLRVQNEIVTQKLRSVLGKPGFEDWKPEDGRAQSLSGNYPADNGMETKDSESLIPSNNAFMGEVPIIVLPEGIVESETVLYDNDGSEEKISFFIENLTDEQLALMVVGRFSEKSGIRSIIGNAAQSVAGAAGETTSAVPGLTDTIVMSDGPAGLRLDRQFAIDRRGRIRRMVDPMPAGMTVFLPEYMKFLMRHFVMYTPGRGDAVHHQYCTAIPIGTAIAQSWNTDFARKCGDIVGEEMERFGIQLWLAPALNIHRSVLCGRNFEYYSEDPLISGRMAAGITEGVQSHPGKGTTIKHFAGNNQEANRLASDSRVSERAMREIYLKGFEICVREAQPQALMTSYNLINGVHSSERRDLVTDILRSEWKFRGIVMTDWVVENMVDPNSENRIERPAETIAAGGDLFMPGKKEDCAEILKALQDGRLSRQELVRSAARVYKMVSKLCR